MLYSGVLTGSATNCTLLIPGSPLASSGNHSHLPPIFSPTSGKDRHVWCGNMWVFQQLAVMLPCPSNLPDPRRAGDVVPLWTCWTEASCWGCILETHFAQQESHLGLRYLKRASRGHLCLEFPERPDIALVRLAGSQVRYGRPHRLHRVYSEPRFTFFNTGMLDKLKPHNSKGTLQLAHREK